MVNIEKNLKFKYHIDKNNKKFFYLNVGIHSINI